MKIRLVGVEFFHAEGQTDKHDEANSRFSQFCEAPNKLAGSCLIPSSLTRSQLV